MKIKHLLAASAGAGIVAAGASADFTGVTAVNMGDMGAGGNTWQLFANFDDPTDVLLAINGNASVASLTFNASAPLIQNSGAFDGLIQSDTPNILDAGGDSWVTIGINGAGTGSDTAFSPGFLNNDGATSVINGSFFQQLDNGGYFDSNPGTPEDGGSVIIAQFTLPVDATGTYEGTASWTSSGAGAIQEAFFVNIPAPGALALLGVAGLAASRRRRG